VAATLVFACEITGNFLVFDANDGKVLYGHNVGGPIAGGMVSYASGGKQHVAAVSGFAGGYYNQIRRRTVPATTVSLKMTIGMRSIVLAEPELHTSPGQNEAVTLGQVSARH
jgi:hypothetical protein